MNIANKLTILRILLVPIFLLAAYYETDSNWMVISTIIFCLASLTDFLDGYLARKYQMVTNFGVFLDPLADKILVAASLIVFVARGYLPVWSVVLIISREYMVSILRAIAGQQGVALAASKGGKAKTATQMLSIILLLLGQFEVGMIIYWLAVILTVYSGLMYIIDNRGLFAQQ